MVDARSDYARMMRELSSMLRDALAEPVLDKTHVLRLIGTGVGLLLDLRADEIEAPAPAPVDPGQLQLFPGDPKTR